MSASDAVGSEGDATDDGETPLEEAVAGVVTGIVLLVAFGLLALGFSFWWVAFPVGFGGLLPAAVALAKYYQSRDDREADGRAREDERAGALDTLRDQYARGVIDEDEFERRVEALLETEDVDAAREYARRERDAREARSESRPDPLSDRGSDVEERVDGERGVDADFDVSGETGVEPEPEPEAETERERS